ncbi:hypothetical protein FACS1894176_04110 [Bacteroidia bacterium]|nr:hypothetical protein FACS1894176_04110 [Bacteroidia bacterium]
MKTKILLLMMGLCNLFAIQAQEWGYVNTLTNEWLRKICTQGLDTVYIVGENGLIAQSTDRGNTWNKQHFSTDVALNDIIFTDHYTGFAVGEQGTILKTTNAGETWAQLTTGTTTQINAIAATGLDNIWVVGDNSLILHSTDSGETWQTVNILTSENIILSDIAFRNNLGYFTGDYATVYKTEDSGETWTKQTLIDNSDSYYRFHSLNITENKTYMMCMDNLFSTEDQLNWAIAGSDYALTGTPTVSFLNDSIGYGLISLATTGSTGNYGHYVGIIKTINGGRDWNCFEEATSPTKSQESYWNKWDIKVVNDTLGYIVLGSVLLKTPAPTYVPPDRIEKIEKDNELSIFQLSSNELYLRSKSNEILTMRIFDVSGKELLLQQWANSETVKKINIINLPEGIYIIKTTMSDNVISINKWIKQ